MTMSLMVGADNVFAFANPAVESLLGYAPSTLVGRSLSLLMPQRLRHAHEQGIQRHLATGEKRVDGRGTRATALHAAGHGLPIEIRFARLESDFLASTSHELRTALSRSVPFCRCRCGKAARRYPPARVGRPW